MRIPGVRLAVLAIVGLAVMACAVESARGEEPPAAPILRIGAGMHTSTINRIATDAAHRFLVTGSDDKTVRVWNLADGHLLGVLRAPLGAGNEGKIYAVAMAPDGSTVAFGGATGGWDRSASIYFFDVVCGRLRRRVSGLPNIVLRLAWSPDGRFLAAALHSGGVRVFRTDSGALVAQDAEYAAESYGVDFDRAGRLVTTCYDGFVRLYDAQFRLVAKVAPGGNHPHDVRFAPGSSRVVVGFDAATRVVVLSGKDLSLLYAPDMSGVDGILASVAWSDDGRFLYAGGAWQRKGAILVRRWDDGGRGSFTDLECGAHNTIMDLCPLANGRMAWGAFDPAWGVLAEDGRNAGIVAPPTADFRNNLRGFCISANAEAISYAYQVFGGEPARFDVDTRNLAVGYAPGSGLQPPRTQADGLKITDWSQNSTPRLNGAPLRMEQYDSSFCLALAPDGQRFLLGTYWWLRCFNRQGMQQWQVSTPGVALAVNVAGSGAICAAAFGDGTIRWYRMRDGQELLAFFPHSDKKRWVLWTPSGYYDCSPGGEDLIGWHINRGKDQAADFFPASRLRSTYYHPDAVSRVLSTGDEAEALRQADEATGRHTRQASVESHLPPVVTVVSPQDSSEVATPEVALRYTVRTPSGEPITEVRALIDGRPAQTARDLQVVAASATERTLRMAVPPRDCTVSVIAFNRFAASEPSSVRLRWRGQMPRSSGNGDAFVIQPKLYVLAVGVGAYPRAEWALRYPAKDARDLANVLAAQKGALYRDVEVKIVTDKDATKDNILDALDWIRKETTSKDVAMVFLSGHGINDTDGTYYFVPVNFDPERIPRTGVPASDIRRILAQLAGKALFFFDSCHSGNVLPAGQRTRAMDPTGVINELISAENGTIVFAASTGRQVALEDDQWGNGAFTKALVEGIAGQADYQKTGRITVNMLDLYISERVKTLTKGKQTPTTAKPSTVPDFPIAVKK